MAEPPRVWSVLVGPPNCLGGGGRGKSTGGAQLPHLSGWGLVLLAPEYKDWVTVVKYVVRSGEEREKPATV